MRIAIWLVCAALGLAWTGGAWLASALAHWSAQAVASGAAEAAGRAVAAWPVPPWLAVWMDPSWVRAVQGMLAWSLDAAQGLLPWVGSAVGWLVPVVWGVWVFGMVLLLVLAAAAHWGLSRGRTALPARRGLGN
jgi:hypothetical protein